MNARSYDSLRRLSRCKFTMSHFIQLKALAKNTVDTPNDYLLDQMNILLDLYSQLDSKVDELDSQIKECVRGIDLPCLSIPGIGELSVAVILSEFGSFSKFQNPSKMLSFAGLEPSYYQSGQSEFSGRMVKHGSSCLRYALMNCCLPLITNEPGGMPSITPRKGLKASHTVWL